MEGEPAGRGDPTLTLVTNGPSDAADGADLALGVPAAVCSLAASWAALKSLLAVEMLCAVFSWSRMCAILASKADGMTGGKSCSTCLYLQMPTSNCRVELLVECKGPKTFEFEFLLIGSTPTISY